MNEPSSEIKICPICLKVDIDENHVCQPGKIEREDNEWK